MCDKNPMFEYSQIKVILWRAFRVFFATFLTQLGLGVFGVTDLDAAKILIVSSLSAGLVALGKAVRTDFGGIEKNTLVDKLPF
jgi:hypothetical protein